MAGLVRTYLAPPAQAAFDAPLFTWSPLGLYGVTFGIHSSPATWVLSLPPLTLAVAGWLTRMRSAGAAGRRAPIPPPTEAERLAEGRPERRTERQERGRREAERASDALALIALAGALWTTLAADLVSQYLGVALFLLGTAGVLWAVAGAVPAGRRLVLVAATSAGLLASVLLLGKVNGHFVLSQLSTAGFTSAAMFGVALSAAGAAAVPPFHGWLLRIARHPFAPALAAAGTAVALTLVLTAFRTTAGQLPLGTQRWLVGYGWLATLMPAAVVLRRRSPVTRLVALYAGKAGLLFFALEIATPVALASALLYVTLALPAHALLWWLALTPSAAAQPVALGARLRGVAPLAGQPGQARWGHQPTADQPPLYAPARRPGSLLPITALGEPWQTPGFWIYALLLASAAGLPGTVGGVVGGAFGAALTSWPSGDLTLRVPPFLLDAATLAIGGGLLWGGSPLAARLPRLAGWRGWLLLAVALALLVGPALAPAVLIGRWFGPVAAAAAGTGSAPLSLELSARPPALSIVLGLVGVWALVQRLRRREWLPSPVRAVIGGASLVREGVYRTWRRSGAGGAPAYAAGALWLRLQGGAERVMETLRPFEERYYAAAAVMVAVALIYIIGR